VSLSDEEIMAAVAEVYEGSPWGGWNPDQITAFITFARLIQQKQREIDAALCEKSDRYRGDYFASIIREQK